MRLTETVKMFEGFVEILKFLGTPYSITNKAFLV